MQKQTLRFFLERLQKQLNVPKQDKLGVDLKRTNSGKLFVYLDHSRFFLI